MIAQLVKWAQVEGASEHLKTWLKEWEGVDMDSARAGIERILNFTLPLSFAAKSDWIGFVLCIPSGAYRLCAFAKIQHHLPDDVYYLLLSKLLEHGTSSAHALYKDLLRYLLLAPRVGAEYVMSDAQLAEYCLLPDKLLIFRGYGAKNQSGLYFTTNPIVACDIAHAHGSNGKVTQLLVPKKDVLYLGGIGDELLYLPGLGQIQSVMNGTDETAKEKLREQWRNNPPEGFTATRS